MESKKRTVQIFDEHGNELLSKSIIEQCITIRDMRIKCEESLSTAVKIVYDGSILNDKIEIASFFREGTYHLIAKRTATNQLDQIYTYIRAISTYLSPHLTMKLFGLLLLIYTDNIEIALFFSLIYFLAFISFRMNYILDTYSENVLFSLMKVIAAFFCSVFIINFEMKIK